MARGRFLFLAMMLTALVATSFNAGASPIAAIAQVRQGDTLVRLDVVDGSRIGYAAINGQQLSIQCVKVDDQFYMTTLLIPGIDEGTVVVKGRLPSGKMRWITILKRILGPPRMSVRSTPGEDWGWCGTGGVSFTGARSATGYVVITPA